MYIFMGIRTLFMMFASEHITVKWFLSAFVVVQDLYSALYLHIHHKNTDFSRDLHTARSLHVSPAMSIAACSLGDAMHG